MVSPGRIACFVPMVPAAFFIIGAIFLTPSIVNPILLSVFQAHPIGISGILFLGIIQALSVNVAQTIGKSGTQYRYMGHRLSVYGARFYI
jgi:hypothetical protein